EFQVADDPYIFFTISVVFVAVWFEASEPERLWTQENPEWTHQCPAYHGERPHVRLRKFVVVRVRLNHSLCFGITFFEQGVPHRYRHGHGGDYVVLYSHGKEPPKPHVNEDTVWDPISLVTEERITVSPTARLDCARIHTLEDRVKVRKIGSVHPKSLPALEDRDRRAVE
ncbi:hypothetical protein B0T14DRAFT_424981, partial [Immersiella caudata]